jgi:hypothetical protein
MALNILMKKKHKKRDMIRIKCWNNTSYTSIRRIFTMHRTKTIDYSKETTI